MNTYLVPANAKKGTLIFNMFLPLDLWILGVGCGISFFLLLLAPSTTDIAGIITILMPSMIAIFLVIPMANYHNIRVALMSIFLFFTERRRYIWKGWCIYERFGDKQTKK